MHFNFAFTAVQILWTLTFAAHLVLLVVLLGRDRTGRFPWFTIAIALVSLRLISSRLLFGRLPQLTMSAMFIVLADLSAVVALLVLIELARRAFGRASRRAWIGWTLALLAVGALVLATWGSWPAWKTLAAGSPLALLSLLQLLAQKLGILADVLTLSLGVLVIFFGRSFGAGARSHAQQIVIGLSTASLAQVSVQVIWQIIAKTATPHSMAEYDRIVGLREKLFNGNSVIYLAVAIWWIVCLWIDEPGSKPAAVEAPAVADALEGNAPARLELPEETRD